MEFAIVDLIKFLDWHPPHNTHVPRLRLIRIEYIYTLVSVMIQTRDRIYFIQYWEKEKAIVPYMNLKLFELSKTYPIIVILAAGIILSNFQKQKTLWNNCPDRGHRTHIDNDVFLTKWA